jgi:hypothetical protein
MNINFAAPKTSALEMGHRKQSRDILENVSNNFDYISVTHGDSLRK